MVRIEDIETPAILVDLDTLEKNLKNTAMLAARAGVKLRPHCKTHKSIWLAKKQLEYGACGITVAKLSEAEVMVEGGITDILVAYPIVGETKLKRLKKLMERASIIVSTDSIEVTDALSNLGQSMGKKVNLYVEVNSGLQRCGREPGKESAALVEEIMKRPGIEVLGLMTHGGFSYDYADNVSLLKAAHREADALLVTKQILEDRGISIREISVGSTPTSKFIEQMQGVTEVRPGAYVYGDGQQLATGIITEDECALYALTTVVSTPRTGNIIVDAGSKTLGADGNPHWEKYGTKKGDPDVYIEELCEEHGIMRVPANAEYHIGDKLMILPNHCCMAADMHEELYGIRDGIVERMIKVNARGKIL